jgi:hypothetical protein
MTVEALDIKEKISIINHSDLADAKILDVNYLHLIHDTADSAEKSQFTILHLTTQKRIQELTN